MDYEKFREKYGDILEDFSERTEEEKGAIIVHSYYDQIKELLFVKDLMRMNYREQMTAIDSRIKSIEATMVSEWKEIRKK